MFGMGTIADLVSREYPIWKKNYIQNGGQEPCLRQFFRDKLLEKENGERLKASDYFRSKINQDVALKRQQQQQQHDGLVVPI